MSTKSILCVGMCVFDVVHICSAFPDEDSDRRSLGGHLQRGGNASNNCTVLRNLGAKCEFLGVLSNSKSFSFLREDNLKRGIATNHCPITDQDPPFSSVLISEKSGTRTIIHTNCSYPILTHKDFQNAKLPLEEYKWIHFEGRNPQETECMLKDILDYNLNLESTDEKIVVSVELEQINPKILILAEYADYVFLGKDLAKHLGWHNIQNAVHGLRNSMRNKKCFIICTWGSLGCAFLSPNENVYEQINANKIGKIIDTLGAGDTFCAGTIYALNKGISCKDAVLFGNELASYKISNFGYDHILQFQKRF